MKEEKRFPLFCFNVLHLFIPPFHLSNFPAFFPIYGRMCGMNPFRAERGPSGPSSPSSPSGRGPVLTQDVRRATRDEGPTYETRRSYLKPDVRKYADKLYAEIKALYAKYGAENAADLYARAKSGVIHVPKEDAKRLLRMQTELETALTRNELPEGHAEKFPSYEVFKDAVDRINASLPDGYRVEDLDDWENYELIDGKLNGIIKFGGQYVPESYWLPIINGELVLYVDGCKLSGTHRDVVNIDGKLNGTVMVYDRFMGDKKEVPVIAGKLIEELEGHKIEYFSNTHNVGGKLNGSIKIGNRYFPVIDGHVIESVDGRPIEIAHNVQNVGGKLYCGASFKETHGDPLPIVDGHILDKIGDDEIQKIYDFEMIDGKINARVKVKGTWYPVIAGKIIKTVSGHAIEDCNFVKNIDDKLNCKVEIDGKWRTVFDGELIEEIDGKKVTGSHTYLKNVNGKFFGTAELDGEIVFYSNGKPIQEIQGVMVSDWSEVHDAGGVASGIARIKLSDGTEVKRKVLLGKFLDE